MYTLRMHIHFSSLPSLDRRFMCSLCLAALTSMGAACSSANDDGVSGASNGPWTSGVKIPAEKQDVGDPVRGRQILLNGSYMSCGVPAKLWDNPLTSAFVRTSLGADGVTGVAGREGRNGDLPHTLNAFTTADGAEVLNRNCLGCHAGPIDGELVIGLGNATADFTGGLSNGNTGMPIPDVLLAQLGLSDAEKANFNKVLRVGRVFGPDTVMRTVGQNPAEAFTGVLLSHHDPVTLAWSDEPLKPVIFHDGRGGVIAEPRLTSDPPPWWRAKKKNALFYNGMARGDHRGTMALATGTCVDDLAEAERVDGLFRDMQAFIGTLTAPVYQRAIDAALAAQGKTIFTATCAGCHGTYTSDPTDDAKDTYPNLLFPLDVIGTDPAVANMGVVHAPEFVDWYNVSFYGKITRAVPNDPFPGYMAPPLDGVWATAPYFHNGSVPTIALVLNSKARPAVWKRVDLDGSHYDEQALGWPWEAPPYSQAAAPQEQKFIYDASYWSQSNAGHTFGDALTDAERRSVIEYLKTL
jgi:mono/diheme cytochrome c family protein